jgi:ribonuclease P protein component
LGRTERLKSRKLIEELFDKGKSFTQSPYRIFYMFASGTNELQAGFGVSAKNFKRAVDRNRIKRLGREAWRLQKLPLQNKLKEANLKLVIFLIFTAKTLPEYSLVESKMKIILQKLISLVDENHTSDP